MPMHVYLGLLKQAVYCHSSPVKASESFQQEIDIDELFIANCFTASVFPLELKGPYSSSHCFTKILHLKLFSGTFC